MISSFFNWRSGLALVAIAIGAGTILYSRMLANKIAAEERLRVEQWVEAGKLLVKDSSGISDRLVGYVITANTTIPIIETDEAGTIIQFVNLDSAKVANDSTYVQRQLEVFRSDRQPITWSDPLHPGQVNYYYYGHTPLLDQVQYYPIVQLVIVALFIVLTIVALSTNYRSRQNQVWAGMAKETAHQLGTPLTSLKGWVEMLRENPEVEKIVSEMSKDVDRLQLISDRFGKIGSIPHLEPNDLIQQIHHMMEYIRKRSPERVQFIFDKGEIGSLVAPVSPPLFDWVIENLLKNALDAMEGKGVITLRIREEEGTVTIDVQDTGKGIQRKHVDKVFDPGFTTKKRGWGLGLSLAKRIIEQYHKGQLFVKQSEPGKGTTFRIILRK
jgi:signal transduction histidine kinase